MAGWLKAVNTKPARHTSSGLHGTGALRGGSILALAVGLLCSISCRSQQLGTNGMRIPDGYSSNDPLTHPATDFNPVGQDYEPVMSKLRSRAFQDQLAERQKQMVSDANQLLKLAKELNEELIEGNAATLKAQQLRKIGEIEKLARRVREQYYK